MSLLFTIFEVEIEVEHGLGAWGRAMIEKMLDNRRAEHSLATSRNTVQKQKGPRIRFPIIKNVMLYEPNTSFFTALSQRLVVI